MKWYWISLLTLTIYWFIGCIVAGFNKDNWLELWAMGFVYSILYVLFYPIRAWKTYTNSCHFYQNHNITRLQYIFGKRVHKTKKEK